ncbi:putative feruloyl esterase B, partial [Frankliniella fusca]
LVEPLSCTGKENDADCLVKSEVSTASENLSAMMSTNKWTPYLKGNEQFHAPMLMFLSLLIFCMFVNFIAKPYNFYSHVSQ